jgi:hypothetical protein
MVIEFRCPNGHRLNCPDERAGLPGKCPKCKATFRVPQPGVPEVEHPEAERPEAPISDSGVSEPEITEPQSESTNLSFLNSGLTSGDSQHVPTGGSGKMANPAEVATETESPAAEAPAAAPAPAAADRIIFLCPNGHKLNCPASMQGRPGKCPHCGATFLVPQYEPSDDYDDEDEEDEESDDASEERAADDPARERAAEDELIEQTIEGFNGDAFEGDPFAFDFSSLTTETAAGPVGGMAGVFQRLWLHKRTGGIVELYLKGGEVIAPEWFAPRQSQDTYGMFAYVERDGSYTMTAVNWDAIERVAVRGVAALPEGMFDEET